MSGHDESPRRRFFAADSYWNTPIGPAPAIAPESEGLLALMAAKANNGFWLNLDYWTVPVYDVGPETPRHQVRQFLSAAHRGVPGWQGSTDPESPRHHRGQTPDFNPVPIPAQAVPSREDDAHLALVDWRTLTAWDLLGAGRRPDGGWVSCTGIRYRLDGPGVFEPERFPIRDGESIHYFGPGRASGVPIVAGLIMRWEVAAGRIEHRLAFSTPCSALGRFIHPPAIWTDGPWPDGIPEGAVVQLDPALDLDPFALTSGARAVARALQEYGAVNTDTGGGNALYGEGLWAQPGRQWAGLLTDTALMRIPLKHYRVLRLANVITRGMSHSRGPA
jgi:hypothetical protein